MAGEIISAGHLTHKTSREGEGLVRGDKRGSLPAGHPLIPAFSRQGRRGKKGKLSTLRGRMDGGRLRRRLGLGQPLVRPERWSTGEG